MSLWERIQCMGTSSPNHHYFYMSKSTQAMAAAFLGLAALFGSFALASADFAYGSQSALAAAVGLFDWNSSISISRNTNSPSGSIIPGRSQVLAVFDVKGRGLSGVAHITKLPVLVSTFFSGSLINMDNFYLAYKYCVPKGNIYAYGYKYGYSGLFCGSTSFLPSSVTKIGSGYEISFSNIDLPVYSDQTSAIITIAGNAYYGSGDRNGKTVAKLQARIPSGGVAQVNACKTIRYGFKNRYGYVKCYPNQISANTWLAFGNILSVTRSYGYYTTGKPTDPSRPPIIEHFPPVPQTAPTTGGNTTQGAGTAGTQTSGTDTGNTVTPTPTAPKSPIDKNTTPRTGNQFETQTP